MDSDNPVVWRTFLCERRYTLKSIACIRDILALSMLFEHCADNRIVCPNLTSVGWGFLFEGRHIHRVAPSLKRLDCTQITSEALKHLAEARVPLEHLDIGSLDDIQSVSFPTLKSFVSYYRGDIYLIAAFAPNLTDIKFYGPVVISHVTDDDIRALSRFALPLETIGLDVEDEFVEAAAEMLNSEALFPHLQVCSPTDIIRNAQIVSQIQRRCT